MNALIGGWEWDGVARVQSGAKFNYGGYRLVGMSEQEFQDMFKFYHETGRKRHRAPLHVPAGRDHELDPRPLHHVGHDGDGVRRRAPDRPVPRAGQRPGLRAVPGGDVPGTAETRIVTGPMYGKVDMSFVKRFRCRRT